jgi:hypothetical protein
MDLEKKKNFKMKQKKFQRLKIKKFYQINHLIQKKIL